MFKIILFICTSLCAFNLFAVSLGNVEINGEGELSFYHFDSKKQLKTPYINEFTGSLHVQDQFIIYKQEQQEMVVGHITEQGAELCDANYPYCEIYFGEKYPERDDVDEGPIHSVQFHLITPPSQESYNLMNPYVMASPNQLGAGSCLYMAVTGAMEIILNQNLESLSGVKPEGDTDLSERYLMNVHKKYLGHLSYSLTDVVQLFNIENGALRNRDYRFTKGWYKKINGSSVPANPNSSGATYGVSYNWVDGYTGQGYESDLIPTPYVTRSLIYKDPAQNKWNVGILKRDAITKVKKALKENDSPIVAVYNHMGYWHAVLILGYDDQKNSRGCPFVKSWQSRIASKASTYENSSDPGKQNLAKIYRKYLARIKKRIKEDGGCSRKGVFYVRDSIYQGPSYPKYDYDPTRTGEEEPYSKKIVEKSYNWLTYLGNHIYLIKTP